MDLLNNVKAEERISKNDTEMVVKQKKEYALLGTYQISKGLSLFSYNSLNGNINLVNITKGNVISTMLTEDGWLWWDNETQ